MNHAVSNFHTNGNPQIEGYLWYFLLHFLVSLRAAKQNLIINLSRPLNWYESAGARGKVESNKRQKLKHH